MKPQVLIVYGAIGSGKSKIAEQIADRAKLNGYQVYGVISRRVMKNSETVGYDGLDPQTGKTTKLVYKGTVVTGHNWKPLRGPFWYNVRAFKDANERLIKASNLMDEKTLIIIDEYGYLEARGLGLYPGLSKVVEALSDGGKLLILCRTDKIDNVLRLFAGSEAKLLVMESSRRDLWSSLGDYLI